MVKSTPLVSVLMMLVLAASLFKSYIPDADVSFRAAQLVSNICADAHNARSGCSSWVEALQLNAHDP